MIQRNLIWLILLKGTQSVYLLPDGLQSDSRQIIQVFGFCIAIWKYTRHGD
uniref:Uncharacterized protein n=1 Tax=Populus trichocarpa TaxID=3694 RepID=A9P865_POPTR|nr:unknown [Populus trichocarpa]